MMRDLAMVDYHPGAIDPILQRLTGMARESAPLGPGLTHGELVQWATWCAISRDAVCSGAPYQWAWFKGGQFRGMTPHVTDKKKVRGRIERGERAVTIWGIAPPGAPFPAGPGLPRDWGRLLALATDDMLAGVKMQRTGSEPGAHAAPVVALIPLLVIVGGSAATVVSSVAIWRYLDPSFRERAAEISAALQSYRDRIDVHKKTGQMPPPSYAEVAAADVVRERAERSAATGWIAAAGAVVGAGTGIMLSAAMRRATR